MSVANLPETREQAIKFLKLFDKPLNKKSKRICPLWDSDYYYDSVYYLDNKTDVRPYIAKTFLYEMFPGGSTRIDGEWVDYQTQFYGWLDTKELKDKFMLIKLTYGGF